MKLLKFAACTIMLHIGSMAAAQKEITVSSPLDGSRNHAIKARDRVVFKPGALFRPDHTNYTSRAFIDEAIIAPANIPQTTHRIARPQVNTALEPGTSAGVAAIDHVGKASYTIPITVAPGTAGMQPELTIRYESETRMGCLGIGWDISGLSAIKRVGRNIHYDGITCTMQFDNNDRFELDGQRLIAIAGNNGASHTLYGTEQADFNQIVSLGNESGGPASFEVTTKEGTLIEYGSTADSKMGQGGPVFVWKVSRITDKNGNYMTFSYHNDGEEMVIQSIKYTGNENGITPYNSIDFFYESNPDVTYSYLLNRRLKQALLLRKIKTSCQEASKSLVYGFKYAKNQYVKLIEITEGVSSGEQYNSTLINWGGNEVEVVDKKPVSKLENTLALVNGPLGQADLDGDGTTDFVYLGSSPTIRLGYDLIVYLSGSDRVIKRPLGSETSPRFAGFSFIDSDYDKKDEIYISLSDPDPASLADLTFIGFRLNSALTDVEPVHNFITQAAFPSARNLPPVTSHLTDGRLANLFESLTLVPVNFTGKSDGLGIIVVKVSKIDFLDEANPDFTSTELAGSFTLDPARLNLGTNAMDRFAKRTIRFLDFNGDGKTEIAELIRMENGWHLRIHEISATTGLYEQIYTDGGSLSLAPGSFEFGDFNGDGNDDILSFIPGTFGFQENSWHVIYNTGTGYQYQNDWVRLPRLEAIAPSFDFVRLSDMDNDGKTDIVSMVDQDRWKLEILRSNGSAFESIPIAFAEAEFNQVASRLFTIADFDGDHRGDIITVFHRNYESGSGYFSYRPFVLHNGDFGNLVSDITDGLNNTSAFSYHTGGPGAQHYYSFYNWVASPSRNYRILKSPHFLTISLNKFNGTLYESMNMSYRQGLYSTTGKGFIGYMEVHKQNRWHELAGSTLTTITQYGFDETFGFTYPVNVFVSNNPRLVSSSSKEYEFAPNIAGTGRYWHRLKKETQTDHATGVVSVTEYKAYDDYGNATELVMHHHAQSATTITRQFDQYGTRAFCPNRVVSEVTGSGALGGWPDATAETHYSYDGRGNIQTITRYPNTANELFINFSYNDYGLPVSKTLFGRTLTARVSTFAYDQKSRFLLTETNPLGHVVAQQYEPLYGNITETMDIDGKKQSFQYNAMGRLTQSTDRYGISSAHTRSWEADGRSYYDAVVTPGAPAVKTWYDNLNRKIRSSITNANNQEMVTTWEYDSRSRIVKETYPFVSTDGPSRFIRYAYNDYAGRNTQIVDDGRETNITYPTPGEVTSTYSYPSTTGSTLIRTQTRKLNAEGLLQQVTGTDGTIDYTYFHNGQVHMVTANGATSWFVYYPGTELLMQRYDPNTGAYDYLYNEAGEVTYELHPMGHHTHYEYNAAGQLTKKTIKAGTADEEAHTFAYGTAAGSRGRLISSKSKEVEQVYAYNEFGNLLSQTQKVSGQSFTTSFAYNSKGQHTALTYPSGFSIAKEYNALGMLSKITAGNQRIWEASAYNELNRPTAILLGENLSYQYTYDSKRQLTSESLKNREGTAIYRQTYEFDYPSGNLKKRASPLKGLEEAMEYDAQHRLIRWEQPGVSLPTDVSYMANGNIELKSDVSLYPYRYAGGQPHAVTGVDDPFSAIGSLEQRAVYNTTNHVTGLFQQQHELAVVYGADEQRAQTEYRNNGQLELTRYYQGRYEKEVTPTATRELHYIDAPTGLAAILIKEGGTQQVYYTGNDYLESINCLVDADGAVILEQSFDAWGRRRNPHDWTDHHLPAVPDRFSSLRGYTGHEHLDVFGLINMNARLYDPLLGRMLGPDKYIQHPTNAQNYNRYSYVLNNPFKYTDPSGNAGLPSNSGGGGTDPSMIEYIAIGQFEQFERQRSKARENYETYQSLMSKNGGFQETLETDKVEGEPNSPKPKGKQSQHAGKSINDLKGKNNAGKIWNYNDFTFEGQILDFLGAAYDFAKNYYDLREANFIGADKYFHAKANFQAAHRGLGGAFFAIHFSNLREAFDQKIKGDSYQDAVSDQRANIYGRYQTNRFALYDFKNALKIYRPPLLPNKY